MIEEDINERMARFAPSQNTIGEMRGPTAEEARRMTMQPTASPDPALDMIRAQRGMPPLSASFGMEVGEPDAFEPEQDDSAIEMIRQSRRERMSATFYGASMVNPDEAGKAQRIASEVGLGPDLVRRHIPEFERQIQMRDFRSRDLPQKDPVLAQFLADRQFAEIAHDDVGTLEKFAPLMVDAYLLYMTGSTLDMRKGAARARLMKEESWIGAKAMVGLATPADLEEAERLNRRAQNLGEINILGTIAEQLELNLRQVPAIATAAVGGAAIGSLAGPGIGTALGFTAGTSAGIIATTAQLEGGLAYLQMRRDGVSEEEAVRAAVGVGLVNGVIELAGMKIASAPFKAAARRIMAQTAAKAVTRPTVRRALAVAATEWGKQAGTEGLEEAAQEITLIAGERIAKAIDGIDPERSLEEEIPRVFESFIVGIQVGAVLGSAGPAVNLALDVQNATVAERQQQMFERLSQLSVDNKVRARNPAVFERFMAAQAGDAGIPDIYVSASAMREVLAQSGLTKEQMDEALPGVRDSLAQATDLREDVVIPTARFASRLAGTPLGDALIPHMRARPNAASMAEMQQALNMKPQLVQELEQATEAIDVARQTEDQQLRTIERKRLDELRAAGRDDAIAKSESRTYRAFVSTMANMLKITPERFESTFGLRGVEVVRVEGEGMAALAAPLEQAARVDTEYTSAIERGDTPTAQRMIDETAERRMPSSQVRNAEGKLLRIYHGSQRIDRVGNRLLKKRATSGPMPFFTDTRAIAEGYAQGKEDTSIENIGYEQWFKYKPRGQRGTVTLDQAWFYLTPEERATATERLYTVGYENPNEGTGEIVGNTETIASRDHVQFLLREARGNALTAAKELWLNSGSLFNDEQKFMDVLKGMGLGERFVYDSPRAVKSGIIEAYANITNPLDTASIPESVVVALQKRANRVRKPADEYGQDAWDKRTRDPQSWMETLRTDIAEGRTQAWTSIPDWVTDVLTKFGYDGIKDSGGKYGGDPHVVWIPFSPEQIKFANPITKDGSGKIIPLSERFDLTSPMMFRQAAPSPARPARGWFDMRRLVIMLNKESDFTTFWHELNHYFLYTYVSIANQGNAPQALLNDLDVLMKWFGMEGDTQEARLASWNALDIEKQRVHYEALAYNSEIYGFEGKAPSLELRSVFAKISAFIRSVYEDIRDNLNKIYRREFGMDLPVLTPEVREVMDRMLASAEEVKTYQAIQSMIPSYLTQEEANMSDGEWAAYQVMREEAEEAAVIELQKASLKQMAWLAPARSRILKEMQDKEKERRKEVRKEAEQEVTRRRVYRAMTYLRRGKLIDAEGTEKEASGTHRLDIKAVRNMYEPRKPAEQPSEPGVEAAEVAELEQAAFTVPEWRKLGKGKYGMLADEGLSPELVAEMFGYANGDAMIRELVDAKPVKEAVEDRTSEIMQRRFGEENTPETRERRIQEALHNEARGRFVAVEWRHMSGATEPVRVMLEAARLAAEDIIARKRIRDIRPAQHEAAEARAARDSMNAMRIGGNPAAAAQAAYTRAKNEVLNAPREDSPAALFAATAAAEIAGEAARAQSLERSAQRIAEFREKYGNVEPDILKIRAKRAQLYQNQLTREALKARQEVTKALKDFRKFFRADSKIAETREMSLVMAARSILAAHGIGRSDMAPSAYLDKLREYNPAVYEAVAPIVARATRERGDYRDMRLEDFRAMAGAVEALWVQARRERTIQVGEDRIAVEAVVAALDRRLEAIGIPEVVPGEKAAPSRLDYAKRFLMQLRSSMRRVESWAEAMDGNDPERPYTRYLWRPIKLAVDNFRVARNNYVKKFVNLISALEMQDGMIEATEIGYTFGKGNAGIGKAELLGAMLHTGNESNYRKLLLGRKWATLDEDGNLDDSRWVAFVSRMQRQGTLTRKDYEFLQASWDLLEEIKPTLQKAHYDLMGFYFKEVEASEVVTPFGTFRGGYVPAATDKFLVSDAVTKAGMAELEADWRNSLPSTGMGMTMTRVETYTRPLVLDVRMIATHMDAALRFAMIQPAVADVLKVLNDRGFSSRLERVDPTAKTNLLIPWLHRAARQIVSEPGRFKMVDDFWRGVRTRTGMSIMFANLRNALQQVTGQFPALLKVKPTYLKSANVAYMTSPRQTANMVASMSPFMNELMNSQMFDIQETMNDIVLNPSKFEKAQEWSKKHGYFLQTAFQNSVNIVVWIGAYNQFLAEKAGGLSQERAQAEAIQEANAAVRITQGSVLPEDISAFEAGTPFYRTLTQFAGYFNSLANVNATEFVRTIREMGWRGGKGKLLYIYMFGIAMPALVSDAIVRSLGGGWDDDDDDGYLDVAVDFFFGSQARLVVAFVPFGSSAFTLATTAFNDKPYDDRMTSSPSVSAIEASTVGVGKAIVNIADEDKELTGKNVRDVMTMLSLVTGIPFSAAGRPVGYLVEVGRGKVEPEGPVDVVRGLVTGVATPDSKR